MKVMCAWECKENIWKCVKAKLTTESSSDKKLSRNKAIRTVVVGQVRKSSRLCDSYSKQKQRNRMFGLEPVVELRERESESGLNWVVHDALFKWFDVIFEIKRYIKYIGQR